MLNHFLVQFFVQNNIFIRSVQKPQLLHQGVTDFHTFIEHYALTMRYFYQLVEIGNNIPPWNYLKVYDCALLAISNSC